MEGKVQKNKLAFEKILCKKSVVRVGREIIWSWKILKYILCTKFKAQIVE